MPARTCANFRELCCGTQTKAAGAGSEALRERLAHITRQEVKGRTLSYEGSHLFRVVPGEAIYGGDLTAGNGIAGGAWALLLGCGGSHPRCVSGGCSIYGGAFADETHQVAHATAGCLSMAPPEPGANTSLYRVSLRPMPELQGPRARQPLIQHPPTTNGT